MQAKRHRILIYAVQSIQYPWTSFWYQDVQASFDASESQHDRALDFVKVCFDFADFSVHRWLVGSEITSLTLPPYLAFKQGDAVVVDPFLP